MEDKKGKKYQQSFPLRARFNYWFDNRIAKGSLGLIRVLVVVTIAFAVLMGLLIVIFKANTGGIGSSVWDSIATVINEEMPYSEDGTPLYIIIMSITAIAGVLFASVLIGLITSAIEGKIDGLKRGNSLVLEKGHIILLGFYPGEYTLLRQLILAAAGRPACVVVVDNLDREQMESDIEENIDVPKNFRIICRTADITSPASLEKCSVETCQTIIVSPTDDRRTTKAILAVSSLLEEKGVPEISVNAIISKDAYRFPPSLAEANNISTLPTNSILAKMIAHSCTQTGLSQTFREVFNFEGSEFYLVSLPECEGRTIMDLAIHLNHAVPTGVFRDDKMILNPPFGFILRNSDRLLVFSEDSISAKLEKEPAKLKEVEEFTIQNDEEVSNVVIIGYNETLPSILHELPENVSNVYLVGLDALKEYRDVLQRVAAERKILLHIHQGNPDSEEVLLELATMANHFIILNDHDCDPEDADMKAMFLLLNLRELRNQHGLDYNITVEMQKEHNQKLVNHGDHTDFLVSSNMSSLILVQLAESPELIDVFREILSNRGNELYLKSIGTPGQYTVRDLRRIALKRGYVLLGYMDKDKNSTFNPPLDETVMLTKEDRIIVLGER